MTKALVMLLAAAVAPAATITVSPQGATPTLTAARDAVRALRQKGERGHVDVILRGGVYQLADTFVLTKDDSDVTYAAQPGERVVISGGRRIEGWKKGSGPVWTAPAAGNFRQLFVNGRRALRARTPTNGFYRIDGDSSQDKPFLLKYRGNDVKPGWAGKSVEVIALLAWSELRMPIASVDESARTAKLTANPRPSNKEKDARYWIENAPDALDSAGEWYLDRAAGTVSYWPASGENPARDEIVAPAITQLVRLDGVRDVTFRGLDFRHADWTMPEEGFADAQAAMQASSAFEAVGAENVVIDHCAFRQSGGYAIWFGRGCKRNRVVATEIADMGAGGVKIGETQQRQDEADRNFEHTIVDNEIHDLGLVYPSAIGVWVGQSSRNTISHNHIHDLYYTAISVGWTWGYGPNQCNGNAIEYNHLHHIGKGMLSDMGAIYTLGMQPGTAIRNNVIHDVWSFTYGGWGIYPDEGSTGERIENNIVYRTKSAGFHQHYGRENVVRNNIFAFGSEFQVMRTRAEPHLSFTFEGNIVYFDSGALLGSNWTGDGVRMDKNVYWDARGGAPTFSGKTLAEWREQGRDVSSAIADPLFRNAASYDFTLLPGSPVWKLGWKQIDVSTVGPRGPAGPAVQVTGAAQNQAPGDAWKPLEFLLGTWDAKTQGGSAGAAGSGQYTFRLELRGSVLARHSAGKDCKGPAEFDCEHDDLLQVYRSGQSLKAIYFGNEGHTIHYDVSTPAPGTAVFLSDAAQAGPQYRLTYERKGPTMTGRFQMRMPGQTEFRSYLEWSGGAVKTATSR